MKDFILDYQNDIVIQDEDFLISDSDAQHLQHLMEAAPTNYRHDPEAGANVRSALNGSGTQQKVVAEIKRQFERDGYNDISVNINGNSIELDSDSIELGNDGIL